MRIHSDLRNDALLCCLFLLMQTAGAQSLPQQIQIAVLEGEGSSSDIRQHLGHEIVVDIENENQKPLAGAAVVFTLPTEGATGNFRNGGKSLTVVSDSQGRVAVQGIRLNSVPGKIPIHVNASYRGLSTRTVITQYSVLPPGATLSANHGHGALIAVLVAVGAAAAAGGAYFATHRNSAPPPTSTALTPTPIGITPGTGSIGGGH
jgi:hypothetical protein